MSIRDASIAHVAGSCTLRGMLRAARVSAVARAFLKAWLGPPATLRRPRRPAADATPVAGMRQHAAQPKRHAHCAVVPASDGVRTGSTAAPAADRSPKERPQLDVSEPRVTCTTPARSAAPREGGPEGLPVAKCRAGAHRGVFGLSAPLWGRRKLALPGYVWDLFDAHGPGDMVTRMGVRHWKACRSSTSSHLTGLRL